MDQSSSPLAAVSSSPLLRMFPSYSSPEDYSILCGSNVALSALQLCQTAPAKTSRQILQELRHLDDISAREQFKFAVLFVAQGQYTQRYPLPLSIVILPIPPLPSLCREILANSEGSELYEKFLSSLGQDIDLATHRGFNGR